jgi:hypothetical protein
MYGIYSDGGVIYAINYSVSGNVRTGYDREGKKSNRRNEEQLFQIHNIRTHHSHYFPHQMRKNKAHNQVSFIFCLYVIRESVILSGF